MNVAWQFIARDIAVKGTVPSGYDMIVVTGRAIDTANADSRATRNNER
jgi:hypothetical protein